MLKKIMIAFIAGVVLLVVGVGILIKVMVTPERVRETILPVAEKRLARKINYTDISIAIFSGIYISDLKILNPNDTTEFVSVGKMALRYRFLPLLRGKIEISEIILEHPKINITRFADGRFNFSDLIPASGSDPTAAKEKGTPPDAPADSATGMDLQVAEIRITDGELHFLDQAINPKSPFRCVLNQFNFKSTKITLEKAFPIEMSAQINAAKFNLSGTFNIKTAEGDGTVAIDGLDAAAFSPYFSDHLPGTLKSATVSIKMAAQARTGGISSNGNVHIGQMTLTLNAMPDVPIENADVSLGYDMSMDTAQSLLTLSGMKFSFNGVTISGKGTAQLAPEVPVVDLSIVLDSLDLQNLMKQAPKALSQNYQDYQLKGRVSGSLKVAGAVDQGLGLLKTAAFDLSGIQATVNNAPAEINGKLSYAENQLKTNGIDFKYAGEGGTLTMDMACHPEPPMVQGNFAVTAKRIDLNSLMAGSEKKPKKSSTPTAPENKAASATPETEPGPFDIPANVTGRITVDEILYQKLPIQQVHADVSLKNNHLTLEKLTARVAGGVLDSTAAVNLGVKGLAYQGEFNLSETDIKALVSGARPDIKLDISGKALASTNFSGKGVLPKNRIPAFRLSGKASVLKGLVKETRIQQSIALLLGLSEIKVLSFRSFDTTFDMKNALMNLDAALDSSNVQAKSTGTVSIEADHALNLKLDLRIAPELMTRMKGGDVTKYITDEKGWGGVVLAVKGTLDDPVIGLDAAGLKETAKQAIKEKLSEKITETLSEKKGTSTTEETKTPKPGSDALKNILKDTLKF